MGQGSPGRMGKQPGLPGDRKQGDGKKEKKYEPPAAPSRVGRRQKRQKGSEAAARLPAVAPLSKCRLRLLKLERVKDYLLMEEEFVASQERLRPSEDKTEEDRSKVDDLRGTPMSVGSLEEIIDESHAIVSLSVGPEYYVGILSFVDKDQLEPGCAILMHNKVLSVVGILQDEVDPMVSVMKVEKAPLESYADIGGLDAQIQEIKKQKTLLAKAVANSTSATFLRVVGSELIQKYLGDGPKLVRELFRVADDLSPSIVFIDEIDAVGTKRYDAHSGGEREIQRTMLELLNQLDGFDSRGDVKVILATNRIESLDPALLRPGRIDRKIEFPLPDVKTRRRIFQIHTSKMTLADDVNLEEFIMSKDEFSGADIKAICTEAGLLALRERRMKVTHADFKKAKEKVMFKKKKGVRRASIYCCVLAVKTEIFACLAVRLAAGKLWFCMFGWWDGDGGRGKPQIQGCSVPNERDGSMEQSTIPERYSVQMQMEPVSSKFTSPRRLLRLQVTELEWRARLGSRWRKGWLGWQDHRARRRDGSRAVLGQSPTDFGPTGVGARVESEENMERSSPNRP
ncbi:unnamed protein product [Miscanthus lutarioriparius]|uniref:AAA+ ATPase domain-containing protein n=1 Tax=Miscanthus lutarioriparius TaxID=422564 RepID=A0A811MSP3_9POAL|nr:unnamed protein product [Miscanthus lutarioriparius]